MSATNNSNDDQGIKIENDVKNWCRRNNKTLLWLKGEPDDIQRCQVQF
jgi:hypothetical protein